MFGIIWIILVAKIWMVFMGLAAFAALASVLHDFVQEKPRPAQKVARYMIISVCAMHLLALQIKIPTLLLAFSALLNASYYLLTEKIQLIDLNQHGQIFRLGISPT